MAEKNAPDINIAIDGPAASGKSTTARLVARALGMIYVDTGAMYRAATLAAQQAGASWDDEQELTKVLRNSTIELKRVDGTQHTFLNGMDVSDAIRQPEIDLHVSAVASKGAVRRLLVARQKEMAAEGGVVMDGRDIGTVVLPDAELKVFMQASIEARAQRRVNELKKRGKSVDTEKIRRDIERRDKADQTRKDGPLLKAEDARILDNSHLSIKEQVEVITAWAQEIITRHSATHS